MNGTFRVASRLRGGRVTWCKRGDVGSVDAGRLVRAGRDRPAGVADRPLQPALHLLHARRRSGLAAQARAAHRRRGRPADPDRRRAARRPGGPVHRRRAAAAPRPGRHRRAHRRAAAAPGDLAHHQRHRAGPDGGPAPGRRAGPGQRLARHAPTGGVPGADPAGPAARGAGRAGRGGGGRAGPGEGQQRADARRQRRRGPGPAAVLPGPRVRAAVHRADAAGRAARLAAVQHGHRRGDPGRAQPGVRAQARRPGRARLAPRPRCSWSTAARPGSASSAR